ncbi:FimB/Mfa2 family fimbrial subunit [Parabacteroides sp. PF5-6]|uniref:FimB/Mfa2 family fimbrial subunit n=1 Tax=Parabacteroides sp. PF5-6 TaxID=1742403 RepID=UPI0024049919|nr:FimB/Mfa2 family fimbrial subunit [Parabacteroides sp. PF5-6]MDF9831796.1 hypothetical protein [Parabacteroides sp. PF5-6]
MKKNTLSKGLVGAWLIATILAFTACSSDDSNMEYIQKDNNVTASTGTSTSVSPYTLTLQAVSKGKDITTKGDVENVTLFVFDENYNYLETKTIDKSTVLNRRTISIAANATDKITVVAYAGLTNNKEEVSSLNQNSILTDLRVQLKQNNGQVTNSPSDLFHGQLSIDRASVTRAEEAPVLSIERKVAELSLTTTGIATKFGTTSGDFYYKIKTSSSMVNYNGEIAGEEVEYILPATMNANGKLTADHLAILPSDDVTIELYRDDILVLSSKNLKNTQELSVSASEQLDIVFDATKANLSLIVAAWGQVINRVTVG